MISPKIYDIAKTDKMTNYCRNLRNIVAMPK
jgi:hypothetical protein